MDTVRLAIEVNIRYLLSIGKRAQARELYNQHRPLLGQLPQTLAAQLDG